jgi:hypothetical protein
VFRQPSVPLQLADEKTGVDCVEKKVLFLPVPKKYEDRLLILCYVPRFLIGKLQRNIRLCETSVADPRCFILDPDPNIFSSRIRIQTFLLLVASGAKSYR